MFKEIPGNPNYKISLLQDIRDFKNKPIKIPVIDGKINIELYGENHIVDLKWLALAAYFEVYLPSASVKDLFKINFADADLRLTKPSTGKIAFFSKPVIFKHLNRSFRVIPGYSRYAINSKGEIINIQNQQYVKPGIHKRRFDSIENYPSVFIYDPDKNRYRYIYVHRLVALTWIPNDDFIDKPIVNHKDGNKHNFNCSNLEWGSYSYNTQHAINNGLMSSCVECRVRDFETGTITEFSSISQACQFMGLRRKLSKKNPYLLKSRLLKDRYEFRLKDDDTPWFYEDKEEKINAGRYTIVVTKPSGDKDIFYTTSELKTAYKLWNCGNIKALIERAEKDYPGYKFTYTDHFPDKPIQAFKIETKEIIESKSINELSKKLKMGKHLILYCLKNGSNISKNGYAFRYKDTTDWPETFIDNSIKRKRVKAVNTLTDEVFIYSSLREASRNLKVDRATIKNSCINNWNYKNWKLNFLA